MVVMNASWHPISAGPVLSSGWLGEHGHTRLVEFSRIAVRRRPTSSSGLIVRPRRLSCSSLYEDGYKVLDGFLSEDEIEDISPRLFEKNHHKQLLQNFLVGKVIDIKCCEQYVQEPGFRCTDGASSPEPWWDDTWEVMKGDAPGDERQFPDTFSGTALLVISCSDRTMRNCGGGLAVYPRSHWLVSDWFHWAHAQGIVAKSLPQPPHVPAATPIELELCCGDAVLFHPLLAWSIAPNCSKSSTNFLLVSLLSEFSSSGSSGSQVEQICHGWTELAGHGKRSLATFKSHELSLLREEEKAIMGGWASKTFSVSLPELPFSCSHVAPRDRLSWQLRSCAEKLMEEEKWDQAIILLRQLAGLRPKSYWVAFNAGRCSVLSAPSGQLTGRAGRKSTLEDGERFLLRAIQMAPGWPLAYTELAQTLLLMGRGREMEAAGVLESMRQMCNFDQLYSKYPEAHLSLKQCQEKCVSLSTLCQEQ